MTISHAYVTAEADDGDPDTVSANEWNANHVSKAVVCVVYRSGTQNVTTATPVAATFNSEISDFYGMHDNTTNNSRITFDRVGWWNVRGHAFFQANATGYRYAWLKVNGTDVEGSAMRTLTPGSTGGISCVAERLILVTATTDYVELWVDQNSGATLTIGHASITPIYSFLEARFIGVAP
jgi:hypothetical protein